MPASPLVLLAVAAAGPLGWSITEYTLHRFLGHDRRTMPNFFSREHLRHHGEGDYFAPLWKKGIAAAIALAVLVGVTSPLVGLPVAAVGCTSFLGTAAAYELFHRRIHTHPGRGPVGRWLRRHHLHHHFGNPNANHGVTSPVWDVVFRTYEPTGRVRVPEKLKMAWLTDPATGDVRPEHAADYELLRRKAKAAS